MIRVKTCFVAEGIVTDRDSGRTSAHNLIEDLEAPGYPFSMQNIAFFCLWERTPSDPAQCQGEFSVTLDGNDMARQTIAVDFGAFLRGRCLIRLNGFAPDQPGTIVFRLSIPGHDTAEWTIPATIESRPVTVQPGVGGSPRTWDSGPFTMSLGTVNLNRR